MLVTRFRKCSAATLIGCVAFVMFFVAGVLMPAKAQRSAFYTRQKQYRFETGDSRCIQEKNENCSLEIHRGGQGDSKLTPGQDYSLNFIEFKDNGRTYDYPKGDQTAAALKQLREAREGNGKVVVFLYIHGWHNSAEERSQKPNPNCEDRLYKGDVDKFRHCGLEVLAKQERPTVPGAKPRIVGIYLAWHGWDFGWLPFNIVPSYYLRMPKARSVGLSGMATAIQQIFNEIDNTPNTYFTIAMGHSFGARALEAALDFVPQQKDQKKYPNAGVIPNIQKKDELAIGPTENHLPVDLVFYVNAATSNADTIRVQNDWTAKCQKLPHLRGCDDRPLYFAVSSRADWLTAIVMPVANAIAMPVGFAVRGNNYSNGYHILSAANTPWLQTHHVPFPVPQPPDTPLKNDEFCFQVAYPDKEVTYEVTAKPLKEPKPPNDPMSMFWIMNSDHWSGSFVTVVHALPLVRRSVQKQWVIHNHGDVWNPSVFNMVHSLINTQVPRVNHRPAPPCNQQTAGKILQGP